MQNFSAVRPRFSQRRRRDLYQAICRGCHMVRAGAKGAGFYHAGLQLTGSRCLPGSVVMERPARHAVLCQQSCPMRQIADVVNHVRSNWQSVPGQAVCR